MRRRIAPAFTLVAAVAVCNAFAQESAVPRVVPVYAIVTDRAGADVADFQSEEITLSANGKPVPVVSFSRDRLPLSVVALLDASRSLEPKFEAIRRIAAGFLGQLQPGDQAKLGSFSDTIQFSDVFTADRSKLLTAFDAVKGGNPTRIHDALVATADVLKNEPGRQIVIVISDGEDTLSRASFREAVQALQAHHVTVYSVGVEAAFFDGIREVRTRPHRDLNRYAEETGGSYFELKPDMDLGGTILRSLQEMRSPYLLSFAPLVLDGKNHKLEFRTTRTGVTIRARKGYVARP